MNEPSNESHSEPSTARVPDEEGSQKQPAADQHGAAVIDELLDDVRKSVSSDPALVSDLESVGLTAETAQIVDRSLAEARISLREELDSLANLAEETTEAKAALAQALEDPPHVNLIMAFGGLGFLGVIVLGLVGFVGLLVTAIEGHAEWIIPWFNLVPATVSFVGTIVLLGIGAALSELHSNRAGGSPSAQLFASLESQLLAKKHTIATSLEEEWLKPAIRQRVSNARLPSWAPDIDADSMKALGQPLSARLEIDTKARQSVESRLSLWTGGSIGLAGPRGIGKSTVIEALCQSAVQDTQSEKRLGVFVAAPVKYDPRDFLLYLFAAVCEEVLTVYGLPAPKPIDLVTQSATPRQGNQLGLLPALGQALRSALTPYRRLLFGPDPPQIRLPKGVAATASELLQDINFQQTFTSGWSGTLSTPIGFSLERGQSYSRQPMSLPAVTARFQSFLEQLGTSHQVVIGIDELDKIASEAEAESFLNDVKGIFAARNCFFVLSISEDAMSSFERRGLPVRDAVDSALDDVVSMNYFRHGASDELLRRRVLGLPQPFVAFCHVVGGGLPRDVLRAARRLAEISHREHTTLTAALVARYVGEELDRKRAAVHVSARGANGSWAVLSRSAVALTETAGHDRAGWLVAACALLCEQDTTDQPEKWGLVFEFLSYAYFLDTLGELFAPSHTESVLRPAAEGTHGSIELLARARQSFALNLRRGWELISEFRSAWDWPTVDFPEPVLGKVEIDSDGNADFARM